MEVGEKTGKREFAVNRCTEFTLGTIPEPLTSFP